MLPALKSSARSVEMQYRLLTSAQRQNPQFLILGAQKGGTASLDWNLGSHPQVKRALKKETHFFDLYFSKGLTWYQAHFPLRFGLKSLNSLNDHSGQYISGEATPAYLFYPFVPERVAALLPNVKLIVMLRDPVARAYSQFQMQRRKDRIAGTAGEVLGREMQFLQGLTMDRATFERCFYDWISSVPGLDYPHEQYVLKSSAAKPACAPYRSWPFLLRGMYYEQLRIWFEHFPREQFLILKSEDYFADPQHVLEEVVPPFLGLSGWKLPAYAPRNQEATYEKIDAALRAELAAFFKPYNEKLYDLLGMDFNWYTGMR